MNIKTLCAQSKTVQKSARNLIIASEIDDEERKAFSRYEGCVFIDIPVIKRQTLRLSGASKSKEKIYVKAQTVDTDGLKSTKAELLALKVEEVCEYGCTKGTYGMVTFQKLEKKESAFIKPKSFYLSDVDYLNLNEHVVVQGAAFYETNINNLAVSGATLAEQSFNETTIKTAHFSGNHSAIRTILKNTFRIYKNSSSKTVIVVDDPKLTIEESAFLFINSRYDEEVFEVEVKLLRFAKVEFDAFTTLNNVKLVIVDEYDNDITKKYTNN